MTTCGSNPFAQGTAVSGRTPQAPVRRLLSAEGAASRSVAAGARVPPPLAYTSRAHKTRTKLSGEDARKLWCRLLCLKTLDAARSGGSAGMPNQGEA